MTACERLWIVATALGSLCLLADGFSVASPRTTFSMNHNIRLRYNSKTSLAASAATVSSNEDLLPGIAAIDASNAALYNQLEEMRTKPYFRLYSVDILASCEYLPQELFECYSETCEIYPVDEDEVSIERREIPLILFGNGSRSFLHIL
jgi:hypothetical protein